MSALLDRVRRMNASELRFRAACELRKLRGRARHVAFRPHWQRARLRTVLARPAPDESSALSSARDAVGAGNWSAAHRALARHFASRSSAFPLDSEALPRVAASVASHFPGAVADARGRAERILAGRYDLLGYTDLDFGSPPDWFLDPVHQRHGSRAFWAAVPYLDPRYGDHKIIWELNRHQHWLMLGRAFALTEDRRYYTEFVDQLADWLARNPPLAGTNWSSMLELAFRSLSWLWSLSFFSAESRRDPGTAVPWLVDLLVAIDRQLTHVEHNLSRYFSPNTHLTGEALALYVAGRCLPELSASGHRANVGREVLLREIDRQILSDGGHAERSGHYHRYSTDFYLLAFEVARKSGDPAASAFADAARRQADYLRTISDDAGRVPQLADDDGGQLFPIAGRAPDDCAPTLAIASVLLDNPALRVGPAPEEAFWFCGDSKLSVSPVRIQWPSRALPESGYYVSRTRAGDHMVFDAGAHGYLNGGHAHSDALSIVLTAGGHPLLIDPGTATYTMAPETRDLFRSTAMHNTVVVNGRPQSRPQGPFHWESAATARATVWRSGEGVDYVEGVHDGYAPLVHTRSVLALHQMGWVIVDHLLGHGNADADAYWHVAQGWRASRRMERTVELVWDEVRAAIGTTAPLHIIEGRDASSLNCCSPAYGRVERATTLHASTGGPLPFSFGTFVTSTDELAQSFCIESAEITTRPPSGWHASAFNITSRETAITLLVAADTASVAGRDALSPGVLWGTRAVQTDARVAALISSRGTPMQVVLINGTTVVGADARALVELPAPAPLAVITPAPELASTVQDESER